MGKKSRGTPELNASSMADIAFLLLIFFLVTTTIASDKGLSVMLPPKRLENQPVVKINDRNLFNIILNARDHLLIENEIGDITLMKDQIKKFLTNKGVDPTLSESPKDAIVSIRTDRATSYKVYIDVLDEVKKAYNEVRAEAVGLTYEQYMALDPKKPADLEYLTKAKDLYPYQVADAEPTTTGK